MKFTVFGTKQDDLNIDDIECLTDVMSQLDLIIDSYNEIEITKNDITVVITAGEYQPFGGSNPQEYIYYFNIIDEVFDNGGGIDTDDLDINWSDVKVFYYKYASIEDMFIDAIKNGNINKIKELNKTFPNIAKPSISNSFYVNFFILLKDIELLEWVKTIDNDVRFDNQKYTNSLRVAVENKFEDGALWLIDNYKHIPMYESDSYLYIIRMAKSFKMDMLVAKMIQNQDFLNILIKINATEYLPKTITDLFFF